MLKPKDGDRRHRCNVSFIYSSAIYDGHMEGMPPPEWNLGDLKRLIETAKLLNPHLEPTVIDREKVGVAPHLPPRGNIAYVYDVVAEKQALIIWFDDYEKDPRENLSEILDSKLDWSQAASWEW